MNLYCPTPKEEDLAAIIDETAAITQKNVNHYVEPIIRGKNRLGYRLKTIDPDWDLEFCLKPFLRTFSIWRTSGALASLSLSLVFAWQYMIWFTEGEVGFDGLIVDFAIFVCPLAILGLYLAWDQFAARIDLWKYHRIRKDLIEEQRMHVIKLDTRASAAPGDIEGKLDLINARWTLQQLHNSPQLPLSSYFKVWSLLGIVLTLVGFYFEIN